MPRRHKCSSTRNTSGREVRRNSWDARAELADVELLRRHARLLSLLLLSLLLLGLLLLSLLLLCLLLLSMLLLSLLLRSLLLSLLGLLLLRLLLGVDRWRVRRNGASIASRRGWSGDPAHPTVVRLLLLVRKLSVKAASGVWMLLLGLGLLRLLLMLHLLLLLSRDALLLQSQPSSWELLLLYSLLLLPKRGHRSRMPLPLHLLLLLLSHVLLLL